MLPKIEKIDKSGEQLQQEYISRFSQLRTEKTCPVFRKKCLGTECAWFASWDYPFIDCCSIWLIGLAEHIELSRSGKDWGHVKQKEE